MGQLAVTDNLGIGVIHLQRLQQMPEGSFLGLGAGVLGIAFLVSAALVAHPDGVLVVVAGMGPDEVLMAGLIQQTVSRDIIMVSCEPEPGMMTGNEVLNGEPTVATRCAAVDDNQIYATHVELRV